MLNLHEDNDDTFSTGYINSTFYWYFVGICGFFAGLAICLFDAMYTSTKVKLSVLFLISLACLFNIIVMFFYFDESDYDWNPFPNSSIGEYSNVNLKSVCISAYINFTLFIAKPLIIMVVSRIRKFICKCICRVNIGHSNININGRTNIIRSTVVHKKPYFQWDYVNPNETNHRQNSTQAETAISDVIAMTEAIRA